MASFQCGAGRSGFDIALCCSACPWEHMQSLSSMLPCQRPRQPALLRFRQQLRQWRRRRTSLAQLIAAAVVASCCLIEFSSRSATEAFVEPAAEGSSLGLAMLSKVLSFGVVAGAMLGKLPQVHAIWKAKSSCGVSIVSIWTEVVSMGIQFAYNVVRRTPLSTYAEVPILFVQLLLLAVTAAWADGYLGPRVWAACSAVVFATAAMALRIVPVVVTSTVYAANATMCLLIVLPQVVKNMRNRSTGQLSFVVTVMTFSGVTTRLFTTLVEVDDLALRLTMLLNWLLTGLLVSQFWIYRPKEPDLKEGDTIIFQEEYDGPMDTEQPEGLPSKVLHSLSKIASSRFFLELVEFDTVLAEFHGKRGSLPSMSHLIEKASGRAGSPMPRSRTAPATSSLSTLRGRR